MGEPTLTIRQPWADLIMAGVKDVENRTWPPDVWHWTLTDPQPLDEPIPMRGHQRLWNLEEVPAHA